MKNRVSLFLPLLLVAGVSQAELKIGHVDMQKVMEKAPQAEKARNRLESEFAPKKKALEAQAREIKTLEDKLEKDQQVMGASEQRKLEKDIIEKKRDAMRTQQEMSEDFGMRRNEEMNKIGKVIYDAVRAVAKEESFDLLLESPLYGSEQLDVSDRVLQKMNSLQ